MMQRYEVIEYLRVNGFKSEADGENVKVYDPVHSSRKGILVFTGFKPIQITSLVEAWKFVEARS